MDSSQLTRKRAAAATLYAARQNPVDADMVTRNNRLKAAAQAFVAPYNQAKYINAPCCPPLRTGGAASDYGDSRLDEASFAGTAINTFTNVMDRRAGAAICCGPPPATTLPQGVHLYGDCCCASAPDAPIITSIIPGNATLIIEFIAPISPIIGYQYSVDNGVTFKNIGSATSPLTITGLTNETTYQVIIRAVNACGNGSNSNMMTATPSIYMIMSITTVDPDTVMALPFDGLGAGGVTVDWGDGTIQTYNSTPIEYTYAVANSYIIRINGSATSFGNTGGYTGADRIIRVTQWGALGLTSLNGAFFGASKLISVPSTIPISVTDISIMFYYAQLFNQNISTWNVSKITNMSYMFSGASAFNQDISGWNVSEVQDMSGMFQDTAVFNQNISGWNVSKVTNMSNMFNLAIAFNQNISSWNVSEVTDMNSMFSGATAFNQDISAWNVSEVQDMSYMFNSALAFNQNISTWNVSNVINMFSMFQGATIFNQNLSKWIPTALLYIDYMFCDCPNMSYPANSSKYPQKIKDLITAGANVNC